MEARKAPAQARDILEQARKDLTPVPIRPENARDQIMYDAGVQAALQHMERLSMRSDSRTEIKSVAREDLPSFSEHTLRKAFGGKNAI